jgi:hypothetical protein
VRYGVLLAVVVAAALALPGSASAALTVADVAIAARELGPVAAPTCAEARGLAISAPADALEADVDGDGLADQVSTTLVDDAPPRCRAFMIATTASGTVARPIRMAFSTSFLRDMRLPELILLAEIDRRPGVEAVVTFWKGAATNFAGVFAFRRGGFVRLRIPGSTGGREAPQTFPYAGSDAFAYAVDCRGRGTGLVRTLAAGRDGSGYDVRRTLLRLRGNVFRTVARRTERWSTERLASSPEFGESPFGTCTVVERYPE